MGGLPAGAFRSVRKIFRTRLLPGDTRYLTHWHQNRLPPAEVMKSLQIALPFWVRAILLVGVICILAGAGLI
jgi:hypothetical protein